MKLIDLVYSIIFVLLLGWALYAYGQDFDEGIGMTWQFETQQGYPTHIQPLLPFQRDAYGPGVHSDATGKPFTWQPQGSVQQYPDPTLDVQPGVYGPRIGMDQYGRPVQSQSLWRR